MRDRIKTLVLDANGISWKAITVDTVLRGLLHVNDMYIPSIVKRSALGSRLFGQRYAKTSYCIDWRDALLAEPALDVELCNVTNLVEYYQSRQAIATYPLVIILHSVTGDRMGLLLKTADWFKARRGELAVFVGNEYNLLTDKIGFLQSVEADYICSQLPITTARWLYEKCDRSEVLPMPHALNPSEYYPKLNLRKTADIGFIGDLYHNIIGDMERSNLVRFFQLNGYEQGLRCDIRTQRLPRGEWAYFLNECKAIIGAESGTYYLDRMSKHISAATAYLKKNPDATFEEVFDHCFKDTTDYVSGKAISSRHFEAIGTKTCQILVEGFYNGILTANEHYISVKKDLFNIDEVIEQFKDEGYRTAMVERTYDYVMNEHTYRHRIEAFVEMIT